MTQTLEIYGIMAILSQYIDKEVLNKPLNAIVFVKRVKFALTASMACLAVLIKRRQVRIPDREVKAGGF